MHSWTMFSGRAGNFADDINQSLGQPEEVLTAYLRRSYARPEERLLGRYKKLRYQNCETMLYGPLMAAVLLA